MNQDQQLKPAFSLALAPPYMALLTFLVDNNTADIGMRLEMMLGDKDDKRLRPEECQTFSAT